MKGSIDVKHLTDSGYLDRHAVEMVYCLVIVKVTLQLLHPTKKYIYQLFGHTETKKVITNRLQTLSVKPDKGCVCCFHERSLSVFSVEEQCSSAQCAAQ